MKEIGQIQLNCGKCNMLITGRTYKFKLPVCFDCRVKQKRVVARLWNKRNRKNGTKL